MLSSSAEQRLNELEDLVAEILKLQGETQRHLNLLSLESYEFKREMRDFKNEMRAFKDEMHEFKNEMRAFKDEMRAFKDEVHQSSKEMNKRWGELANKMGTLAEDLVAPSIPRILRQVVGCPDDQVEFSAVRLKQLHPADHSRAQEFDVVAVCGNYVLINETKSRLEPRDVDNFAQILAEARAFFPHYADKKFIGALASLYVDESVVRYGEKAGLLVLGMGEELMDVLNAPGFVPREF